MQAIAATSSCTIASDTLGHFIREHDLITTKWEVKDGYVNVPDNPGLGIEVDEDALKKYQV